MKVSDRAGGTTLIQLIRRKKKPGEVSHRVGEETRFPTGYFQPDAWSQARRAAGLAFSHCVIERVSLSSILLFMQTQYLRTMSWLTLASLLSRRHWLTHLTSSVVTC